MRLRSFVSLPLLLSALLISEVLASDSKWSWGKDEDNKSTQAKPRVSRGFVRVSTQAKPRVSQGFVRVPTKASTTTKASSFAPATDTSVETKRTPALPEGRTIKLFKKLRCRLGLCDDARLPLYASPPYAPHPLPIPVGPPPFIPPPVPVPIAPPFPYAPAPVPIPVGLPHGPAPLPPIAAVNAGVIHHKPQPTKTEQHYHTHTHIHENKNDVHPVSPYKDTGYPPRYPPVKSGFSPTVVQSRPPNFNSGESFGSTVGIKPLRQGHNNGGFGIKPIAGHPGVATDPLYRPPNPGSCECVLPHQCNPHDIVSNIHGKDISYLIHPRNEGSAILSNSTSRGKRDTFITNRQPVAASKRKTASTRAIGGRFPPGATGCGYNYVCCRTSYPDPNRSSTVCGKSLSSSIHGRVANTDYIQGMTQFGQYPWQAAILKDDQNNYKDIFVCGGTLVSSQHVLTAAHCVIDEAEVYLKVRLGEWDVNSESEFYKHVELPVHDVVIHPQFYAGNLNNDIAIITLKEYIDFYSYPHIAPVCLPNSYADFTHQHCVVTGWGKDAFGYTGDYQQILKEVHVPVVERQSCEYVLQEARLGRDYHLPDGFICAGGEEGKDSCKGDGGGPLVCPNPHGAFELAGLVSWGIECGARGIPGVYVNIPYYIEWIKTIIGY